VLPIDGASISVVPLGPVLAHHRVNEVAVAPREPAKHWENKANKQTNKKKNEHVVLSFWQQMDTTKITVI
jgi:hypothetical protein